MRTKHIEGQLSIFDIISPIIESVKKNCFHCLMYESHRCRNETECPEGLHYEEYIGSTVRQCLCATIEEFQDGYIHCPILDCIGCEKCVEDFGDGSKFYRDDSQNYGRIPRWKSA